MLVFDPINDELTRTNLESISPTSALYGQEGLVTPVVGQGEIIDGADDALDDFDEASDVDFEWEEGEHVNSKTGMEVFLSA